MDTAAVAAGANTPGRWFCRVTTVSVAQRAWHRLLAVMLALLITACSEPPPLTAEYYVFGTLVEVAVSGVDKQTANRAFTDLQQSLQNMHRDWHAWEPGDLTELNRALAAGQTREVAADIAHLIRQSQVLEQRTGGRFNPAIGGLVELWGFHTSEFPVVGPPPQPDAILAWVEQQPSMSDIHVEKHVVWSTNPAAQLDFGGIAKGFGVDLAARLLRRHGITDAIVNAGGDLRAFGNHQGRRWRVAVRNPLGGIIGSIEITGDEAVFTSGNYQRFRQDGTDRYPHIIDPRNGYPARDVIAVTVMADEGALADAAATALVVAGLTEWPDVAASLGLDKILVTDRNGRLYVTAAMNRRIEWAEQVDPATVTVQN